MLSWRCCIFSVWLDIKVKEQTIENMMKGNKIYEPPRYMTVAEAAQQLLAVIERRRTASDPLVSELQGCM